MNRRSWRWIVVVLAGLLAACGATPLPDPPDLAPPDREHIDAVVVENIIGPTMIEVRGAPGSTAPGTIVQVVVLDGTSAPFLGVALEDGSFSVLTDAAVGNEVRVTYRRGDARSAPLDGTVPMMIGLLEPVRRDPCVVVPTELDLGDVIAGDSVTLPIEVLNDCAAEITIGVRMRAPSIALSITAPETTIAPGASTMLEASFIPPAIGDFEEVAFLDVGDARYPITLFGSSIE